MKITKEILKNFQLYKQFPKLDNLQNVLEHLGYIQLDSIQTFGLRSQDLVFYNRLEKYSANDYLELYQNESACETYLHALSLVESPSSILENNQARYYKELQKLLPSVPFNHPQQLKDTAQKLLKENSSNSRLQTLLWRSGIINVSRDFNFRKNYEFNFDIKNKITLDEEAETIAPFSDLIILALKNLGLASYADIKRYFYLTEKNARSAFAQLIATDKIRCIGNLGAEDYYLLSSDLELLSNIDIISSASRLLSPFDNLIRERKRMKFLFEVDYRLECYVVPAKRVYGYYALPILINGEIVGFLDLKLEKETNSLKIVQFSKAGAWKRKDKALLEKELRQLQKTCLAENLLGLEKII
ncbi:MAG: winged helix DNA-binding domain-containing protein [Streptococcaceae bacterium]|jgi:uncharacterized protein YcaQ|nr:winged helix DNA-binding domain-containing protein [Streptococcaceae bacterium]